MLLEKKQNEIEESSIDETLLTMKGLTSSFFLDKLYPVTLKFPPFHFFFFFYPEKVEFVLK